MAVGATSCMIIFAEDAKILRKKTKEDDSISLNQDLEKTAAWSHKWGMEFNAKNCSVLETDKSRRRISGNYYVNNERIMTKTEEKDLGVTVTDKLNFGKHINHITGETCNLLRNIKAVFTHLDEDMMKKLLTSVIRPRLEMQHLYGHLI